MFSRVPLLHGVSAVEESLQALTMGDHVPGLLIPIGMDNKKKDIICLPPLFF